MGLFKTCCDRSGRGGIGNFASLSLKYKKMAIPKDIFLPKWAHTGEEYGDSLKEFIYYVGNLTDANCDPDCTPNPFHTIRTGITAMMVLITAQQDAIDDLTSRVEALENP